MEEPKMHTSEEDPNHCSLRNPASSLPILPFSSPSPPFTFPFFKKPTNLTHNFQLHTAVASDFVREVHGSIVAAADKCLSMLGLFLNKNGFLDKVLSLSSQVQSCCQIPRQKYHNLGILSNHNFAAVLPGDSLAGIVVANGILNFLNIYNTLLVVRLVLTWFPNAPMAIVSPLSTICDPYLNIFRGIIPPLGGTLDLSPILAFLVLNAFTSTASALPAELPTSRESQDIHSHATPSHLTTSQQKWMRRLAGNKSKRPSS